MSSVAGYSGAVSPLPKKRIAGMSRKEASTPPATMMQEIRVPMM